MNFKISSKDIIINPQKDMLPVATEILSQGSRCLEDSRKFMDFNHSARELFGMWAIHTLRKYLEPNKEWFICTDKRWSDDGAVGYFSSEGKTSRVEYAELFEQLYLPKYYRKAEEEELSAFIGRAIGKKEQKGREYVKDNSLFVFYDNGSGEKFYWIDLVKDQFKKPTFLHLYFVSLVGRRQKINSYYFLSFTNQKHRQYLNGEFEFNLSEKGIIDFKRTQDLSNVLTSLSSN